MPTYAGSSGEFSGVKPITDVDPKPDNTPDVFEQISRGLNYSIGGRHHVSEPGLTLRAYTKDGTGAGEMNFYGAQTDTVSPDYTKDTIDPEGDSDYERELKYDLEFRKSGQLPLFHYEHRPSYVGALYTTEGGGEHLVQPMLGRLANFVRGRGLSKPMASGSMTGYSARIAKDLVEADFMQDDPNNPVAERETDYLYGRNSLNDRIRSSQLDDAERGDGETFDGEKNLLKAAIERDKSKMESKVEEYKDKDYDWGPQKVSSEEVQQDTQTFKDLAVEVGQRRRKRKAQEAANHWQETMKPGDDPYDDTYDVPLPGF